MEKDVDTLTEEAYCGLFWSACHTFCMAGNRLRRILVGSSRYVRT